MTLFRDRGLGGGGGGGGQVCKATCTGFMIEGYKCHSIVCNDYLTPLFDSTHHSYIDHKLPLHGWQEREGCITDLGGLVHWQLQYVVGPLSGFILLTPEQASISSSQKIQLPGYSILPFATQMGGGAEARKFPCGQITSYSVTADV